MVLNKTKGSLGFSIIGGTDHSSVPFGINEPGIFISHVSIIIFNLKSFQIGEHINLQVESFLHYYPMCNYPLEGMFFSLFNFSRTICVIY